LQSPAHGLFLADLDSIASALTFAYLSKQKSQNQQDVFLPLVNIPKNDLKLRPEVDFVVSEASIDPQHLCYNDTIDISALPDVFQQLKLILVDHNKLCNPFSLTQEKWTPLVSGILDHHVDEHLYDCDLFRTIKSTGSCTSLVILHHKEFMENSKDSQLEPLAKLALAPILVDSVNLQAQYGRTTDEDIMAVNLLKQHVKDDHDNYFRDIQSAKSKIHHLSNRDLLRKDYKEWKTDNGYKVGISTVPWYLKAWAERDNGMQAIINSLNDWAKERHLDLALIMTAFDRENEGGFQRELLGVVYNERLNGVLHQMEQNKEIQLERLVDGIYQIESKLPLYIWKQHNIQWSRKQVWPFTRSIVQGQEDACKL
jgi:exopolyphosphatase